MHQYSLIICENDLHIIKKYSVKESDLNMSDHWAISVTLACNSKNVMSVPIKSSDIHATAPF